MRVALSMDLYFSPSGRERIEISYPAPRMESITPFAYKGPTVSFVTMPARLSVRLI